MAISRSISVRITKVFQTNVVQEIEAHLMFSNVFPENHVYEIVWENTVEPAGALYMLDNQGYSHILRLCNAPYPLQHWLRNLATMLRSTYIACLDLYIPITLRIYKTLRGAGIAQ
jgi:hypothetical protein